MDAPAVSPVGRVGGRGVSSEAMRSGLEISDDDGRSMAGSWLRLRSIRAFRLPPNSKFFHSFFVTSIFGRMHGALNVGKK